MTNRYFMNLSAALLATTSAFTATPSLAQASPTGSAAPAGSYLQSCQNVEFSGGVLKAQCKTGYKSNLNVSTLEPEYCSRRSDIANVDGRLGCIAKAGTWGKGGATPNGSYKASCRSITVEMAPRPTLQAWCDRPDSDGGPFKGDKFYPASTLNLEQCELGKDIANLNGQLICAPRQGPPPPPPIKRK
jgi:CVNH domain